MAIRDMTNDELKVAITTAQTACMKANDALEALRAEVERRKPLINSDVEVIVDSDGRLIASARPLVPSDRGRIIMKPDGTWVRKP